MSEADWKRAFNWAEAGRQVLKRAVKALEDEQSSLQVRLDDAQSSRERRYEEIAKLRSELQLAHAAKIEALRKAEEGLAALAGYAEQERQIAELAELAGATRLKKVWFEVSPKKAVKICGLRQERFAPTLFQEEVLRILAHRKQLLDFIREHQHELSRKKPVGAA